MAATDSKIPPVDALVDWEFAARTAARVGRPGPQVSATEAAAIVAELRQAARLSHGHVRSVTGLDAPEGGGVLVVDRAGWSRANVLAFRTLLAPVMEEAYAKRGKPPQPGVAAIGSRVTGAEIGGLLGILSSRVLGQYDAFATPGRLLLVAPTIVAVERELGV